MFPLNDLSQVCVDADLFSCRLQHILMSFIFPVRAVLKKPEQSGGKSSSDH